jgi:hypothetical protein
MVRHGVVADGIYKRYVPPVGFLLTCTNDEDDVNEQHRSVGAERRVG